MRHLLVFPLLILTVAACQSTSPAPRAAADEAITAEVPVSPEEEAVVLRLEDRRELDRKTAEAWLSNPSYHQRARMALALGRIGPHTFVDRNGDGRKNAGELMGGVVLLSAVTDDPNPQVRTNAAFALGEIGDPAGIPALLAMARSDEHAGVRAEAIEALSKMAGDVTLADYAAFTTASEPVGVQRTALRYLFRFEGDEALAIASSQLDAEAPEIRRAAAYTLSRATYPAARESLTRLLDDRDLLTRSYAVRALDRIGDFDSLAPMMESVLDIHPWVRTNALRAITSIARAHPAQFAEWMSYEKLVPVLTASDDPDPGTKATAIETLAVFAPRIEAAKDRLTEVASDDEPAFRESAVRALARAFPEETSLLDALLETDSRWIRTAVLQETAESAAGPVLRSRYATDEDPSVRATVVGTIPDEAVESEKTLIVRALDDPDPVVRASAIDRAAKLTSEDPREIALAQERRARHDEINDARIAAISMFGETAGEEALELMNGLLLDPDPMVRQIAAGAIEAAGRERPQYTPLETGHDEEWYLDVAWWARQPHSAVIETVRGPIEIVLLAQDAPITTRNFAELAAKGYYDGTSFMRVVPNFVIQGGDPRNDMTGGPGYAIRDEINLQEYTRGAVGMALSGPDTGGSQFFITHSPQHHLDGGYTIFGRVTDGMDDVVDQIRRGDGVTTIRIDGALKTDQSAIDKSARNPLPIELGKITRERTLDEIPLYRSGMLAYQPDGSVTSMLAPMIKPDDHVEVFLGTWCTDSQLQVPHFYRILDQLKENGVVLPVDYVAVDRSKQRPAELIADRHVQLVPTFIIYRGEQEIGRIEETPQSLLEDDLLMIFARAAQ